MELFRDEYLRRLGPNWGKISFDRQMAREKKEKKILKTSNKTKKLSPVVEKAFESFNYACRVLKCSELVGNISEDDVYQVVQETRKYKCRHVVLKDWKEMPAKILRCISISLGETLEEIDLSNSWVTTAHLKVLLSQASVMRILCLNNCQQLDSNCMHVLTTLVGKTLNDLYLSNVPCIREEALKWLSGEMGFQQQKLRQLNLIDVSETKLVDDGLIALALGCKKIKYINLKNCIELTDKSVEYLAKNCTGLRLINLSYCTNLTNKTMIALGSNCHELNSVCLVKVLNIDDKGITALAQGCRYIEALNISCCIHISEMSLCVLVENCKNISMLNVTGCPEITSNGINALIRGLKYVEAAVSYFGFKPVDNYLEKRLHDQIEMTKLYEIEMREEEEKQFMKAEAKRHKDELVIQEQAVKCIRRYMYAYSCRMRLYRRWRKRLVHESATKIQRIIRGYIGRARARVLVKEIMEFQMKRVFAVTIQKIIRGVICRNRFPQVAKVLREMYEQRDFEVKSAIVVRLQSFCRKILTKVKIRTWKELLHRRKINENAAMVIIQCLVRRFICRQRLSRLRYEKQRDERIRQYALSFISEWLTKQLEKKRLKRQGKELQVLMKKQREATHLLQRVYRGHLSRKIYQFLLIEKAVTVKATIMIQKIYRSARVLHWRDIKMNRIASYVLDRHYLDRQNIQKYTRLRYKQFLHDNRDLEYVDDDDADDDIEWYPAQDPASGHEYWYNNVNSDILANEPSKQFAHELSLINVRVRVYWVVQQTWYEGIVTKFQRKSHRHRILYDDGDHEWINLEEEHDRVQVQLDEGSWVMCQLYESKELSDEKRKIRENKNRDDLRSQSYKDAKQWKLIQNDHSFDAIFMSDITGEIRKGIKNAANWVIQDDGYGYPCFYNTVTGDTAFEDPRFVTIVDEDLEAQRNFVLQEIRYLLYFCVDYWDRYEQAERIGNETQMTTIMLSVYKSLKPKHLSSYLIRARVLFKPASVVDKPLHAEVGKELDYATHISSNMSELRQKAQDYLNKRKGDKRRALQNIIKTSGPLEEEIFSTPLVR